MRKAKKAVAVLAVASAAIGYAGGGAAQSAAPGSTQPTALTEPPSEDLLRNIACLEKRVRVLEGKGATDQSDKSGAPPETTVVTRSKGTAKATAGKRNEKPETGAAAQDPCAATSGKPGIAAANEHLFALRSEAQAPPQTGDKDLFGLAPSPVEGLKIGAYGEMQFGRLQNPNANGQWQSGFDARRFVLLPTYEITKNIIFNAEIEFEHAGAGFDADDKLHGTAEIEQLFIDFKIVDYFNFRAPGIDLVPVGYTNQHHEPTQFYSVQRPELANGLVPTTWKVPASSIYGDIGGGLSYQLQVSASVEDFGDDFGKRTAANTVPPFPQGYVAGIDGLSALSNSRPVLGDFRQLNDAVAYALKLAYAPAFLPGFAGSTSGYFTPNTTPRGAYAASGVPLGQSSLALLDTEFRYRIPDSGLELRGEFVHVAFGNPANLRANNDGDPTNNVGKTMWGWSAEVANHLSLGTIIGSEWEAVPFYRYSREDLQTKGFAGTDLNLPTGAAYLQFHTAGIAIFPSPKLALKLNYQRVIDLEPGGARSDSILAGVGFLF
jgi:Phosphate-selective porin O and P